jgi:energy-coupling factor transporter ATP-binding protein EcfA2
LWHFLLLTGDTECGKTTLIAKLQATEEPKKGTGLEYYTCLYDAVGSLPHGLWGRSQVALSLVILKYTDWNTTNLRKWWFVYIDNLEPL